VVDKKGLLTGIFQVFQTKTWFAENYALLTQEQKDTLVIDLEQEVDKYLCDEFYSDEQELLIAVYNRLVELSGNERCRRRTNGDGFRSSIRRLSFRIC